MRLVFRTELRAFALVATLRDAFGHSQQFLYHNPRCFEFAPRFAAQARLGQQAPDATSADLQSLLRQSMLDAACVVGAAPLRKIALHFLLQLLIDVRVGAGWAAKPLIITTA
jgi:hypothetical protein